MHNSQSKRRVEKKESKDTKETLRIIENEANTNWKIDFFKQQKLRRITTAQVKAYIIKWNEMLRKIMIRKLSEAKSNYAK